MAKERTLKLEVNGRQHTIEVDPARKLLWVLRDELRLTGAKFGCGEAQCGACTVQLDGKPIRSCIQPVGRCDGKSVVTIEGLSGGDRLHPLQRAVIEEQAFQCGYCTAGMIVSGASLLQRKPDPSEHEILTAMRGNICRCGTYPRIVRAIRKAAQSGKTDGSRRDGGA